MASGVALFQCGDHWENQRRTLALALGLRERGWYPVALTYRQPGALFLRHGVDARPLLVDTRWHTRPAALGDAARLCVDGASTYRGVDAGRVFEIEQRRVPKDYAGRRRRARRALELARRTDASIALLDELAPERVFVWNGLTGITAHVLRQLCEQRSLALGFLERGLPPESVFVDPAGANGDSELCQRPLPAAPAYADGEPTLSPVTPDGAARDAWRARHGLTDGRVIFVPLQVERDTNLLFHSDHIARMRDLLAAVADAAHDQHATVVARRHPEEVTPEAELALPTRPNLRYIDDGTVEQACDAADLVVTVNSTVGLTALLRGRPVVALGRALFTNKGLCTEVAPTELAAALRSPGTWQAPPFGEVQRFYRLLLRRYTATANRIPELIERLEPPAARRPPVNLLGLPPARLADAWHARLERARASLGSGALWLHSQLGDDTTLGLTYRRVREPVTEAWLVDGVARLLATAPDRISCLREASAARLPTVRVCAQAAVADTSDDPLLVLDPYLEPHLGWLSELALHASQP